MTRLEWLTKFLLRHSFHIPNPPVILLIADCARAFPCSTACFWGRCVFGRQFIFYAEFYGPVFSGDFAQERFKTFAISLCAQNFHQWFLIRRKTELEIAPFDSEHVGHSCRISQEIFLRWNLYAELFPNS